MIRKQEMLLQPIVAINIGSSGVRAIAADWDDRHKTFHILGSEFSNKHQSIEKGIPTNTSDVGFMLNETLKKLTNRVGRGELKNIFVCVGGRSLQSVRVQAHRLQRKSEIKDKMLNEMLLECKDKIELHTPSVGVVTVLPDKWIVDEQEFDERPKGQYGKDITLEATAFVLRKEFNQKIDDSLQRTPIVVYQRIVMPDADISALTTNEEREQGCAVINMGAQTTTLTIYRNERFVLTKVIPLGGYHVSHDIETLGIASDKAEGLKRKYGTLSLKKEDLDKGVRVQAAREGEEPIIVTFGNLSMIIASRIDEIMLPLLGEVEKADFRVEKIYLTGGASMLKGIVPYLRKKTSVPIDYGTHAEWLAHDTDDEYYQPTYTPLIGTLLIGQMFLEEHPDEEIKKDATFMGKFKNSIATLFGGDDE